jgi:hypothetical protein
MAIIELSFFKARQQSIRTRTAESLVLAIEMSSRTGGMHRLKDRITALLERAHPKRIALSHFSSNFCNMISEYVLKDARYSLLARHFARQ